MIETGWLLASVGSYCGNEDDRYMIAVVECSIQ